MSRNKRRKFLGDIEPPVMQMEGLTLKIIEPTSSSCISVTASNPFKAMFLVITISVKILLICEVTNNNYT